MFFIHVRNHKYDQMTKMCHVIMGNCGLHTVFIQIEASPLIKASLVLSLKFHKEFDVIYLILKLEVSGTEIHTQIEVK